MENQNIVWRDTILRKGDREKVNGHKAAAIWLTGLPGAGKSTIAVKLQLALFQMGCQVFVLDGDNVRHGLNKNLGFSPEDRAENIRRVSEVARLFVEGGFLVITAFISPYKTDRDQARALFAPGDFLETYVKAPLAECERRDPKGHYKKARKGEIKEFTGISAPYEEPKKPEIVVNTEGETEKESVQHIIDYLTQKGYLTRAQNTGK